MQQDPRVARQVDAQPHHLEERVAGRGEAVAAHQHHRVLAQHLRHVAALRHVGHQQIGVVAELVGDIPHRHMRAHVARHMRHTAQRRLRNAERQRVFGMRMHHCADLGLRLINRAVDEALEIGRPRVADRRAIQHELDDVVLGDMFRAQRAGQQVAVRLGRMPHADMAVGIDHALVGQDPVGDHQVPDGEFQRVHEKEPP